MSKSVAVIGSGGHARSLIGVLQDCGFHVVGVYDDSYQPAKKEVILGVELKGTVSDCPSDNSIVLAVGDNKKREILAEELSSWMYPDPIVHPSAAVHGSASMGAGTVVFPKVFINAEVEVGKHCIINSGCIVEHESRIGDLCHISIGSIVAGRVSIGSLCLLGAGAVTVDQISIASNCTIGAGSVVHKSISQPGTYVGNPARKIS